MLIKPMQLDDLDEVVAIEQAAQVISWSKQSFINSLKAGHVCVSLREEQNIIGFAIMSIASDEAEILNVVIAPENQHQGFGAQLMQHLLKAAANKNITEIFLHVAFF